MKRDCKETAPESAAANLLLDASVIKAVQRFNRVLRFTPRFKMRSRFTPLFVQSLLRLSQLGADRKLQRSGIRVEQKAAGEHGVPVRILRPAGPARAVVIDIHGGGWVIGNPTMDDAQNAALVRACEVAVVSVDYRLLPGVTLREAMDDCLAAARWVLAGGIGDLAGLPVFILGESAGAHLAATVLLGLKNEPALLSTVAGAVLYYGVYDLGGSASVHAAGPETLVLHGPWLAEGLCMLLPDCGLATRRDAAYSPGYGDLAGMPPALMFAGTRDPLLEDTTVMAARWRSVADVELHVVPEAPHGFLHFPTPLARIVPARTHAWIEERIAAASS